MKSMSEIGEVGEETVKITPKVDKIKKGINLAEAQQRAQAGGTTSAPSAESLAGLSEALQAKGVQLGGQAEAVLSSSGGQGRHQGLSREAAERLNAQQEPSYDVPPELVEQTLAGMKPKTADQVREALKTGKLGDMDFISSVVNGELKLELADPEDRTNKKIWMPGEASAEGENQFSTQRFEEAIAAAPTPAARRELLDRYIYTVEQGGGDGFSDANIQNAFYQVIDVTIADPAEAEALRGYFKARSGLDALHRFWRKHTYDAEAKGKFYTLRDFLFNTKKKGTPVAPQGDARVALWDAFPQAQYIYDQIESNPNYRNLFKESSTRQRALQDQLKADMMANAGLNSADPAHQRIADQAYMLAERTLQVTRRAELYGETVMQGPSAGKAVDEANKGMWAGIKGALSSITGIKV